MKGFRFRLQGLLTIKSALEREVRRQLTDAQALCRRKELEIETTEGKIGDWGRYYNDVQARRSHAVELAVIDRHLQGLYRFREQLRIGLEILERKRDDLMLHYRGVRKEVRLLEHLRDAKKGQYAAELARLEQKEADETAALRFSREEREGRAGL